MNVLADLLPWAAGVASAFAAQFGIQVWVAPKVEGRARRDERWERDVLEFGDLIAGEVRAAALAAQKEQVLLRAMRDFPAGTMDAEDARERRQKLVFEQSQKARAASDAFTDLVGSRVVWATQKVVGRGDSPVTVEFFRLSVLYSLQVRKLSMYDTEGLNAAALGEAWSTESERRRELITEIRELTLLRHAPRKSRRWQLIVARRWVAVVLTPWRREHAAPALRDPGTAGPSG